MTAEQIEKLNKVKAARDAKAASQRAAMDKAVAEARAKKPITDADLDKSLEGKAKGRAAASRTPRPKVAAPKASPTIAQEVANVKAELPKGPLQGQGSMADKPVAKSVVKVPEAASTKVTAESVKAWEAGQDADRRIREAKVAVERRAPAIETGKVMNPSGAVEATAPAKIESDVAKAYRSAARAFDPATKIADREATRAASSEINKLGRRVAPSGPSLASKVAARSARTLKGAGKALTTGVKNFAVDTVKSVDPTAPYRNLVKTAGAARTSRQVIGAGLSGLKNVGKGIGGGILAQWAGERGYAVGSAVSAAQIGTEKENALNRQRAMRQGMRLEGGDEGWKAAGKGLVSALTLGQVDLGKDSKVVEDPALKAKYQEKLRKHREGVRYNELKAKANRNVQRGGGNY